MKRTVGSLSVMLMLLAYASPARPQQIQYLSGQAVVPIFEGWEKKADGSYDMVFGYLNRNYREELNIAAGANNKIEPDTLAQPQPTYFYPRRHRFLFHVNVPKDWGKKDVVWTIVANGKTEKAYGYLVPEMEMDNQVMGENRGGGAEEDNKPPTIAPDGPTTFSTKVGQAVTLAVKVSDDGIPALPKRQPRLAESDMQGVGIDPDGSGRRISAVGRYGRRNAPGLRVAWLQWRGPGKIKFDPWYMEGIDDHMPDFVVPPLPPNGRITTNATFSEPGTYVIKALADDGSLITPLDLTVTVTR